MADPSATAPRAVVIGHPIGHSRSPLIHRTWLQRHAIAGRYEPVDVAPSDLPAFFEALRAGRDGLVGGNVTLPHKEAAFALADRVDGLAAAIGAVNTLWLEGGRVHATNTDVYGFAANLDERAPEWCDTADRAVVLGAGGASRAVIQALVDRHWRQIHVVNRTEARARHLAERFGSRVHAHPLGALPAVMAGARLVVNTTSAGIAGSAKDGLPPIDFAAAAAGAVVTDIVYVPLVTPFLAAAAARGLTTVDGLGMLLHQAVPGFERWFGRRPDVDDGLRRRVLDDLGAAA